MLKGLKYFAVSILAVVFVVITRNDLSGIRGISTDSAAYTTQLAELTRLEKEMLRFRADAASVFRGDGSVSADDMRMSFDILWSRVNVQHVRTSDVTLEVLGVYNPVLLQLSDDLKKIDAVVAGLKPGDSAAWQAIETAMARTALGISSMTNQSYTELNRRSVQSTLQQRVAIKSLDHIVRNFVVLILAAIIFLLWQFRKTEQLNEALRQRESEIIRITKVDPLTGLNNRRHFDERMQAIDEGSWVGNLQMLLVDLDGFKHVNDSGGHAVGDEVLKVVATRLLAAIPAGTLLARLGGDEFAIVHEGSSADAAKTAHAVIVGISQPLSHSGREHRIGASIGIASISPDAASPSSAMLHEADLALYEAKARGRGCAVHFTELRHPPARKPENSVSPGAQNALA